MSKLILVSKSPRRRKILKDHGINFTSSSVEISEHFDKNLSLNNALKAISRSKVGAFLKQNLFSKNEDVLLLGCDTLVCLKGCVLGKPKDKNEAKQYLSRLSGAEHEVKTAISIYQVNKGTWVEHVETSKVKMKVLSDDVIDKYISSGEPFDKAGGYAIQGLGKNLVESFSGSWYNIVGFPIEFFLNLIDQKNWVWLRDN